MALTRRLLKGMGLTDEQVETIIEAHTETVDGLKADVAKYKNEAEDLAEVKKELATAKEDLENERKDSWKVKYDAIKEEYGTYKAEQEKKAIHSAKEAAYRELLKQAGVSEKRIPAILKVSDIDAINMDEKGGVVDADKLTEGIKNEWNDFIVSEATQGVETSTPAQNSSVNSRKNSGRAAKIAAEYQKSRYGESKKNSNKE